MRPKLLLHICCGPCATHVIDALSKDFQITGFFYNPNVWPREEWQKRKEAAAACCHELIAEPVWEHQEFLDLAKGLGEEQEGGKRCELCYKMRLEKTAQKAKVNDFEWFATTLTIGPNKKAEIINQIGRDLARQYGLKFFEADFKKVGGFQHSVDLSKKLGLYRQKYCGCEFSIKT